MTTSQLLYSLAHAIIDTIDENVELKEEVHKLRKENKEYDLSIGKSSSPCRSYVNINGFR